MDRVHTLRIVGPTWSPQVVGGGEPTPPVPPDDAPSIAGVVDSPPSVALTPLRARLLRMILDNERERRHEKQPTAG